tara:strand:- start:3457 stop:3831 length:375 start_codon:yes stop_codon:yes gene_type:complete
MSKLINFIEKNKEAIIQESEAYMDCYEHNTGRIMLVDEAGTHEQSSEIEFKFYPLSIKTAVDPLGQKEIESIDYRIFNINYRRLIDDCDLVCVELTTEEENYLISFLIDNENKMLYPYIPEHQF